MLARPGAPLNICPHGSPDLIGLIGTIAPLVAAVVAIILQWAANQRTYVWTTAALQTDLDPYQREVPTRYRNRPLLRRR